MTAGMIACGTYKNHPNVIWTNEEKLMLSDVSAIRPPSTNCTPGGRSTADRTVSRAEAQAAQQGLSAWRR
ncbi:transmembrane serine/threonine-kinase H PknH domain protein [Mycobacterium kansasii 662]|uniref:Transmembrane serine/threonine-kinase H PknH domain protein n=1 Tax=Mycobacterium kansasii 662 TaxID=1299326 RepID=X7XX99_MYCKA|nr:transmembrane serine/threonine-kinase H PknH domain protein [Mycobacterium kansasii 662]